MLSYREQSTATNQPASLSFALLPEGWQVRERREGLMGTVLVGENAAAGNIRRLQVNQHFRMGAVIAMESAGWDICLCSWLPLRVSCPDHFLERLSPRDRPRFRADLDRWWRAVGEFLKGEIVGLEFTAGQSFAPESLPHYLAAYAACPEFSAGRGVLFAVVQQEPELADEICSRMLEITPEQPRVWSAYLQHLSRFGERARFNEVLRGARQRWPDRF